MVKKRLKINVLLSQNVKIEVLSSYGNITVNVFVVAPVYDLFIDKLYVLYYSYLLVFIDYFALMQ